MQSLRGLSLGLSSVLRLAEVGSGSELCAQANSERTVAQLEASQRVGMVIGKVVS